MIYELKVNATNITEIKKGPANWPAPLTGCRLSDILVKTLLHDTIDKHTFFIINS